MARRKVSRDLLDHLPEIHRLVADLYLADGRWELIESSSPSAIGRALKELGREWRFRQDYEALRLPHVMQFLGSERCLAARNSIIVAPLRDATSPTRSLQNSGLTASWLKMGATGLHVGDLLNGICQHHLSHTLPSLLRMWNEWRKKVLIMCLH